METQADRQELAPSRKPLETTALADLVIRYRGEVVPAKKGADVETIVLNAFLRHPICKKKLSDLTPSDFANYRDERLKSIIPKSLKRQLAPKPAPPQPTTASIASTVKRVLLRVKACKRDALMQGTERGLSCHGSVEAAGTRSTCGRRSSRGHLVRPMMISQGTCAWRTIMLSNLA